MVARLAPLLLLAACSRAQDMATCRLVGTWAHWPPLPPTASRSPAEIVEEQVRRVAVEGHDGTESFFAEGTWINRTGPGLEHRRRWRLITRRGDLISVQIETPEAPDGHLIRRFAPASNDFLIEEHDIYEGAWLVRVPDPK